MQFIRQHKNGFIRFFVLLPLLFILGFCAWYTLERTSIKSSVLEKIQQGFAPEALITFTFSKADSQEKLNWKHAHEFEYLGEMYDIVASQIIKDSVQYTCFHDTKESKLNRRWYKFIGKLIYDVDDEEQKQKQKKNNLKLDYFIKNKMGSAVHCRDSVCTANVFFIKSFYNYHILGPAPPPPNA
ncbi:hypothetical protein DNU06_04265 [Putridiphycobacter roseus]|uniref:Uncharacterized protein n=1 Tax=Putridiphycobacter roseus TaxID=2219161 RepID=A0A2W1N015_9FLAO|nr:hypothetical protein [Putridiphycobacter roseus]PZE17839.1 hypothetical protein DNU06_04265 [Putridiphycobacter roseus]